MGATRPHNPAARGELLGAKPQFSVPNPQQVLPLPYIALEAHTFGNLKRRDHAPLDLLPRLPASFACSTRLAAGLIILSSERLFLACPQAGLRWRFPTVQATIPAVCEGSSKPPTSHWRLSHRRNLSGSACAGFPKTSHIVTVHTRRSPMKKMARPTSMILRGIAEK